MRLSELENIIEELNIINDGEFTSLGLAISETNEKLLSFIEDEKYINKLAQNITCIITTSDISKKLDKKYGIIVANNPRIMYFTIHNILGLNYKKKYLRKSFNTVIGKYGNISRLACVSDTNVIIGENVIIEEFVVIRENTIVEDNAIIRAGCIIGGEGYEFKRNKDEIFNIVHCGGVIIRNNVEVQYNSTIDKAVYTWDNTVIDSFSKLDNMVHIEHGAKIGKACLIASKAVIGGRTIVGDKCWIGLGAIISNGINIGDGASISLGAVVTKSIESRKKVSGNFAVDHNKYLDFIKSIR